MECRDCRSTLWPPERPKIARPEVVEARAHLETCPACRDYFAQDPELLESFARLSETRAPRRVKERVFDALASERARALGVRGLADEKEASRRLRYRTGRWWTSLGALAVAGVGAVVLWPGAESTGEASEAPFVEDYLRRAVGQERLETNDAAAVSRFVMRELGLSITVPQLEDLQLAAVEVCLLDGHLGAMITYTADGYEVSHYIVPATGGRPRMPEASARLASDGLGEQPAVVTWASTDVEQALVGGMSTDWLLNLARRMSIP